ncbi:histidine phosphatase family protein [Ruania zhangjianzhongii]|uniref:histidine phosphatase family protein n=1 Tax=Ruania zhangjianzhongii TaxID=2603206 RepID=UPI0011C8ADC7|nr:histidine phosphatase family protein [Ruania zhangjianzhongii]
MATRYLYLARHGSADPFGELTETGHQQAQLLGRRLAHLPIDAVWHSPLPRAEASAVELAGQLATGTPVAAAEELIDHIPYVPSPEETPAAWVPFFDGYDAEEAEAGNRIAQRLTARFATAPEHDDVREVLITHAFQIAWLLRDALAAPPTRWFGLPVANAALTVIEYRPAVPPSISMMNEMSHLPAELRWTGFSAAPRP